jgi:hypothetical protein
VAHEDGLQERARLRAERRAQASQVSARSEQPDDHDRVHEDVSSSDQAAHGASLAPSLMQSPRQTGRTPMRASRKGETAEPAQIDHSATARSADWLGPELVLTLSPRRASSASGALASRASVLACKHGDHAYEQWSVDEVLARASLRGDVEPGLAYLEGK